MKDLRPSKIIFATISIFVLIASALAIEWPWDKEPLWQHSPTPAPSAS